MDMSELDILKLKQLKFFDKTFEWDYECAILASQSSFGEQAFLIGGGIRLVSIKCYTSCYLAELDRVDFEKVIKKIKKR